MSVGHRTLAGAGDHDLNRISDLRVARNGDQRRRVERRKCLRGNTVSRHTTVAEPLVSAPDGFHSHPGTFADADLGAPRRGRRAVVQAAIRLMVTKLAEHDSQAEHEEGGGGLRTVTFANGRARDLEDLNPGNLASSWATIKWAGGTKIMPGWQLLFKVFNDEFGNRPPHLRPALMALVITDGEADDAAEFANSLAYVGDGVYVVLAVIGWGDDYERALRSCQAVQARNSHVRVMAFQSVSDAQYIANTLLQIIQH